MSIISLVNRTRDEVILYVFDVPPGGIKLLLQVTHQVRAGERARSCRAAESYTALVINAIIQTRLPVL